MSGLLHLLSRARSIFFEAGSAPWQSSSGTGCPYEVASEPTVVMLVMPPGFAFASGQDLRPALQTVCGDSFSLEKNCAWQFALSALGYPSSIWREVFRSPSWTHLMILRFLIADLFLSRLRCCLNLLRKHALSRPLDSGRGVSTLAHPSQDFDQFFRLAHQETSKSLKVFRLWRYLLSWFYSHQ